MTLVPDASAIVEVLSQTPTGHVLEGRLTESELLAPDLLDVEVAATLRRTVLRGEATMDQAMDALTLLRSWPIRRVPHADLLEASTRWWNNVTAYDAMYLATATLHEGTVLTVDGPLARAPVSDVVIENVRVGG